MSAETREVLRLFALAHAEYQRALELRLQQLRDEAEPPGPADSE